jgi:hypothetical protein
MSAAEKPYQEPLAGSNRRHRFAAETGRQTSLLSTNYRADYTALAVSMFARRHEGCVLGRRHQHLQGQRAFADRLLRRRGGVSRRHAGRETMIIIAGYSSKENTFCCTVWICTRSDLA